MKHKPVVAGYETTRWECSCGLAFIGETWMEACNMFWRHKGENSPVKYEVIDGTPHRWRRGKLVPIPDRWFGRVTHPQTMGKRPSKHPHKMRKLMKHGPDHRFAGPTIEEFY